MKFSQMYSTFKYTCTCTYTIPHNPYGGLLIELHLYSLTVANESLRAEVEPKHGRHVEWGASLDVLDVGVSP